LRRYEEAIQACSLGLQLAPENKGLQRLMSGAMQEMLSRKQRQEADQKQQENKATEKKEEPNNTQET
jgi:uncharacterized protein with von Willebrand factor type A (vWA) domain